MVVSDDLRKRVVGAVVVGGLSRNQAARHFKVSIDLAPEKRLPRPMMDDFCNGSKMDEEIADGLHA
jgi:hypothetical protein